MNPAVDAYFAKLDKWKEELLAIRKIVLDCQLAEELKWHSPCYAYKGTNIAIIGGLKDYCVLSFFKGALLKDEHHLLEAPGENTQSGRVIKFTNTKRIAELEPILKAYIFEAIEVEEAGLKVDFRQQAPPPVPEELENKMKSNAALKKAWNALTPGRQRGYLLHFTAAKQPKTREARINKFIPKILEGKGMNDW